LALPPRRLPSDTFSRIGSRNRRLLRSRRIWFCGFWNEGPNCSAWIRRLGLIRSRSFRMASRKRAAPRRCWLRSMRLPVSARHGKSRLSLRPRLSRRNEWPSIHGHSLFRLYQIGNPLPCMQKPLCRNGFQRRCRPHAALVSRPQDFYAIFTRHGLRFSQMRAGAFRPAGESLNNC
jgi:hypothetical protein